MREEHTARSEPVHPAALAGMRLPVEHPQLGRLFYEQTAVREDPDGQVTDTIALMRRYVIEDADSPEVAQALAEARAYAGDPVSQVWHWVHQRLQFVHDEVTASLWENPDIVEVLIRPRDMYTLQGLRQGDCDDYTMMGAAMLLRIGVPVSFVTVAAEPAEPSRFTHVYLAAYPGGQRIPLDASHGDYPGWEVSDSRVFRKVEWPVRKKNWLVLAVLAGGLYAVSRAAGIA